MLVRILDFSSFFLFLQTACQVGFIRPSFAWTISVILSGSGLQGGNNLYFLYIYIEKFMQSE